MHCKGIHIFVASLILYLQSSFVHLKALIGHNIRRAIENEFSSIVCLKQIFGEGYEYEQIICTGTLISRRHFLTSEHCFTLRLNPDRPLVIAAESVNLRFAKIYIILWWQTYDQWTYRVNAPAQRLTYNDNDIAVGRIRGRVHEDIIPAVVSTIPVEQLYGLDVTVAGFGLTNTGRFLDNLDVAIVKIIPKSLCDQIVSYVEGSPVTVDENLLCTNADPYIHLEIGDSGGPIFLNNTIVGVNMGSCPHLNNDFHADKVNVHINVALYVTFIIHSLEI